VCHGPVQSSFPDHERWGGAVTWGTTTPQPAAGTALAPLSRHAVVARPGGPGRCGDTSRRAHAPPHAVVSGPPTFGPSRPRSRAAWRLILREIPRAVIHSETT
jgi:hypothetical protein